MTTDAAMNCDACGKSGATLAYFATGMTEVVYRHHECERLGAAVAGHHYRLDTTTSSVGED
jgi:hypothetical protein